MSHVATALPDEAQVFYDDRVIALEDDGLSEDTAMNYAYAEMLHRFLPEGHPVLRYYYSNSFSRRTENKLRTPTRSLTD